MPTNQLFTNKYFVYLLTITLQLYLQDLTPEQRKEQQIKYGIYFDDDYNYLQHLKDSREVTLVVQPVRNTFFFKLLTV